MSCNGVINILMLYFTFDIIGDMPPKRRTITLTVIGDAGVGKTILLNNLCKGITPTDYHPTIDDLYTTIVVSKKLEIWDTSSLQSDPERKMRLQRLKKVQAILILYDRQNVESTENLSLHLEEIRSVYSWQDVDELLPFIAIMAVKKTYGPSDPVALQRGRQFAMLWDFEHFFVSLVGPFIVDEFERCVNLIEANQLQKINVIVKRENYCCTLL